MNFAWDVELHGWKHVCVKKLLFPFRVLGLSKESASLVALKGIWGHPLCQRKVPSGLAAF